VWNTPRDGYPGQPINPEYVSNEEDDSPTSDFTQIHATFVNSGNDPTYDNAVLFYKKTRNGVLLARATRISLLIHMKVTSGM
jgi:hypothetical protein